MIVYYNSATEKFGTCTPNKYTQFECLNELKNTLSRASDNLLKMNRFVFECDTVDKQLQINRALNLIEHDVACRVVDSGNKSIHVIIELADNITDISYYKQIWHQLNKRYFNSEADTACSNPNRLTRCPNAIRLSNNNVQTLLASKNVQYVLDDIDLDAIKSEADRLRWLAELRNKSFVNARTDNDNLCRNWNIITRYINTPFPKLTGNVNSSKWLFAAVKTCQKYHDNATLQEVLRKARSERWTERELDRLLNK